MKHIISQKTVLADYLCSAACEGSRSTDMSRSERSILANAEPPHNDAVSTTLHCPRIVAHERP